MSVLTLMPENSSVLIGIRAVRWNCLFDHWQGGATTGAGYVTWIGIRTLSEDQA